MNIPENESLSAPKPTLQRLPNYLNYLKQKQKGGLLSISSTMIAEDLRLNHVQVRKDLALVSDSGRPKTGFIIKDLIEDVEVFLGYKNTKDAILVGAGQLGKTLLSYGGFSNYGLNILAAFDIDDMLIGTAVSGKQIFSLDKMRDLSNRLKIKIGIITVPAINAQAVCEFMVECGILAIWNFAPTHLTAPSHIIIQNEDMAESFVVLSNRLAEKL